MREILFRGKKINSEWVKGDYVIDIFTKTPFINTSGNGFEKVDPKTVGQYTGLTDKNGTKIFEGDIVLRRKDKELVFYDDGGFSPFAIPGWECTPDADEVEVIGNIHDNPELLAEK